ncbi:MAG: transcription repressor NadR [Dethiobacter sp.]|nr:transcription repressor NadR [Dethiobacter sp.]MBS3901306.1 transcription repressor NadR [Dethiobacter sp.]MBS3988317.1 transcription repressor NadR [Dethiobacter sp.]
MNSLERRHRLLLCLKDEAGPVTGTCLAELLTVSRQVIVQDIAILRAGGAQILATPQGYLLNAAVRDGGLQTVVACCHDGGQIEEEIGTIVDYGGKLLDVIVEHPLYGELRGNLMIANRRDLALFLAQLLKTAAKPLSALTGGVHLHTIEAADQAVLDEIREALLRKGFLLS